MACTLTRSFQNHFTVVDDPRIDRSKRHLLIDILFLAVCATIAGADGPSDIADFGRQQIQWLRKYIALPNGSPSHDTIGRNEQRDYVIAPIPKEMFALKAEWKGLRTIGRVIAKVERDGKQSEEVRYFISSLPPKVKQFADAVRGHWGIENSLHWVLDVVFGEDASATHHARAVRPPIHLKSIGVVCRSSQLTRLGSRSWAICLALNA